MLNIQKLRKVVEKDGKIEGQCPACVAAGADATGNHLVLYPDGKYGCVANPGDDEHSKLIFKLVGQRGDGASHQLTIRRLEIAESNVLMKIGRLGRQKPTPVDIGGEASPQQQNAVEVDKERPDGPDAEDAGPETSAPGEFTPAMVRQFLDGP